MAEACTAAVWGSLSPLEAAKTDITAKREPSRGYVTCYFNTLSSALVTCWCSVLSLYFFFKPDLHNVGVWPSNDRTANSVKKLRKTL